LPLPQCKHYRATLISASKYYKNKTQLYYIIKLYYKKQKLASDFSS